MNKKQMFKFSGITTPKLQGIGRDWDFEGYFVKQAGNNDIFGINRDILGKTFLKGLFIDNQSLIFVEISEEMRVIREIKYYQKRGYAFKDINEIGKYSEDDMEGTFAYTDRYAVIQLNEIMDLNQIQTIEKQYKEFYEKLVEFDKYYFDNSQTLTEFL